MTDEYTIRNYRPTDRESFLDLFETVFDGSPDSEWFAWKYERNPYTEDVPIIVAETKGELVGARSFFALDMETRSRRVTALQPCDTMVHVDHRRQGLFTRMTEAAIERYRETDVSFFFNFPNSNSLPGNLKLGWRVVTNAPTAYRIQRPGRFVADRVPRVVGDVAGVIADGGTAAYHRSRRRLVSLGEVPPDLTIERESPIPATELASIARRELEGTFQPARDEMFYEWRFGNPDWNYTAYLARDSGGTASGFVVGSRQTERGKTVQLTEVVPLRGQNPAITAALVDRVLKDYAGATTIICATDRLPQAVRSAFGFVSDDSFPLSRVSRPATLVARPLGSRAAEGDELSEADWMIDGKRLDDPTNWTLSLGEQDWC